LIGFRTFRNSDPPQLAEVWRTRSGLRGYVQPMTTALWERWVLAKPYFENDGLQVAIENNRLIGFAHAGFGPTDDEQNLSHDLGASIMVVVRPHDDEPKIAAELIARAESYLRSRGAKVLYGGGIRPLDAFYLGLYGGSELPGILDSDAQHQSFFRAAGYREIDRTIVLHRELAGFRPAVDRQQIQLRRRTQFDFLCDPPLRTWWEACTAGDFTRLEYRLSIPPTAEPVAKATLVDLETFSHTWGVRTAGIVKVDVAENMRRQGFGKYLLSEVMREAAEQGFGLVEVQTMEHNSGALAVYSRLGFHQVDTGVVFRKE
jgi:ribosomal protein S18 acetylase RimI-like enzyme